MQPAQAQFDATLRQLQLQLQQQLQFHSAAHHPARTLEPVPYPLTRRWLPLSSQPLPCAPVCPINCSLLLCRLETEDWGIIFIIDVCAVFTV